MKNKVEEFSNIFDKMDNIKYKAASWGKGEVNLLQEQLRIEIAELMKLLEINKKILDLRQYLQLEHEVNRKIGYLWSKMI